MAPRLFLFAAFAWLAAGLSPCRAEDLSASATLSQSSTEVGDPVELQVKVTGSQRASQLELSVDGLEITYQGSSTQVQLNNFTLSTSVVQTYSVKPLRAGKFVIPGQVIDTGGAKVATNAVRLSVGQGDTGTTVQTANRLAFGELVISKQTAYVGEMLPVEFRIYVDARVRWNFQDPPEFEAAGFTTQKMPQPVQSEVRRNGRPYELVVFKTAIAPVKAGKLTFGPASLTCQAQIPQRRAAIPHFGNDPFADDFFNNPFGMFAAPQDMTIKSDPVEIEAKPLPPGQPKSFGGAVGSFALVTDSSPSDVRVGDPVTLSATIAGWGNLDGIGAPRLTDEEGWRVYPPSSKIKAGDDVRIHGSKVFEIQMIPLEKKTSLPGLEFSYFDPITEKYVTLTGKTLPVTVTGGSAAPAPALAAAGQPAQPEPQPARGILYIRTDAGPSHRSFEPLYRSRAFWAAQLAPLVALAGFAGFLKQREKARTARARQLAVLRRERQALWRTLERSDTSYAAFVDAAARCIQIDTAFFTGENPSAVDAEAACASRPVTEATSSAIGSIFSDREAICYAGVATGTATVPPGKRAQVLAALKEFDHAPA